MSRVEVVMKVDSLVNRCVTLVQGESGSRLAMTVM